MIGAQQTGAAVGVQTEMNVELERPIRQQPERTRHLTASSKPAAGVLQLSDAFIHGRRAQAKDLFAQSVFGIPLLCDCAFEGNQLRDQGIFGLTPETRDFDFQRVTLFGRETADQYSERRLRQICPSSVSCNSPGKPCMPVRSA